MLRWPPESFWKATTWDVMRAQKGYLTSKGVQQEKDDKLTGEDISRIKLMMDREQRKMARVDDGSR